MPTKKSRLMFTLDLSIAADLRAIARFKGVPLSQVVSDSMGQLAPVFRQMVTAIEFLERADAKAAQLAATYTGEFERKLAPSVRDVEAATLRAEEVVRFIEASRVPRKPAAGSGKVVWGIKGLPRPKGSR